MTSITNENKWKNIGSRTRTAIHETVSIPEETNHILRVLNSFGTENKIIIIASSLESSQGITSRGTLIIEDYLDSSKGILTVSGGIVNDITNFSIQALNGLDISGGPIYQNLPDVSNQTYLDSSSKVRKGNVFRSIKNVFDTSLNDQNTIVGISGNLFVTEFSQRNEASNNYLNTTVETSLRNNKSLLINTLPYFLENSFVIYDASVSEFSGNVIEIYDHSKNIVQSPTTNWKDYGVFFIDGTNTFPDETSKNGATDLHGHTRMLRGLTICNPRNTNDLNYDLDISNSDKTLNIFGGVCIKDCDSNINAHLDISGPTDISLNISENNVKNIILFGNGDASFNNTLNVGGTTDTLNIILKGSLDSSQNMEVSNDFTQLNHNSIHTITNNASTGSQLNANSNISCTNLNTISNPLMPSSNDISVNNDLIIKNSAFFNYTNDLNDNNLNDNSSNYNLLVLNDVSLNDLNLLRKLTYFGSNFDVSSNVYVENDVSVNNDLIIGSPSRNTLQTTTITNNLSIGGNDVSFNKNLNVNNNSVIDFNVEVSNNLFITNSSNDSTSNSILIVDPDSSHNYSNIVSDVCFNSNLYVSTNNSNNLNNTINKFGNNVYVANNVTNNNTTINKSATINNYDGSNATVFVNKDFSNNNESSFITISNALYDSSDVNCTNISSKLAYFNNNLAVNNNVTVLKNSNDTCGNLFLDRDIDFENINVLLDFNVSNTLVVDKDVSLGDLDDNLIIDDSGNIIKNRTFLNVGQNTTVYGDLKTSYNDNSYNKLHLLSTYNHFNETTSISPASLNINSLYGYNTELTNSHFFVGAPKDEALKNGVQELSAGSVYVYSISKYFNDSLTINEIQKITATDASTNSYFGNSIAVNDNNILAIGSYLTDISKNGTNAENTGSVYIYDYNSNTNSWSEIQKLTATDQDISNNYYGFSIVMDNSFIAISTIDIDSKLNGSSVYVYDFCYNINKFDADTEVKLQSNEISDTSKNNFGYALKLDSENKDLYIGAPGLNNSKGGVFKFNYNDASWNSNIIKITATDLSHNDFYGNSIDYNNNKLIVSATGKKINDLSGGGVVYVHDKNNAIPYKQTHKINSSDTKENDSFGEKVIYDLNKIIVSTNLHDTTNFINEGAVYFYDFDETNITNEQKLTSHDPLQNNLYGTSISFLDNVLIVGASRGRNTTNAGQVSVVQLIEPKLIVNELNETLETLTIPNDVVIKNDLQVLGDFNISPNFNLNLNDTNNNYQISNNLNVNGNASMSNLTSTNLNQTGNFQGDFVTDPNKNLTFNNVIVSGTTSEQFILNVPNSNTIVKNDLISNGNINAINSSSLNITERLDVSNTLSVPNDICFNDVLVYGNDVTNQILNTLNLDGSFISQGDLQGSGTTNIIKQTPHILTGSANEVIVNQSMTVTNNFYIQNIDVSSNVTTNDLTTEKNYVNDLSYILQFDGSFNNTEFNYCNNVLVYGKYLILSFNKNNVDNTVHVYEINNYRNDLSYNNLDFTNKLPLNKKYNLIQIIENPNTLEVYSNIQNSNTFISQQEPEILTSTNDDNFGYAVAMNEYYLAISSPFEDVNESNNTGIVYIFKVQEKKFELLQTLKPTINQVKPNFGTSLALNNNYVVVGSSYYDKDSGIVYIFKNTINPTNSVAFNSTSIHFILDTTIVPPQINNTYPSLFGNSVSIDNSYVLIGAKDYNILNNENDISFTNAGTAFIYNKPNGSDTWTQIQQINPVELLGNTSNFGNSVILDNSYAIISAPNDNKNYLRFKDISNNVNAPIFTIIRNVPYVFSQLDSTNNITYGETFDISFSQTYDGIHNNGLPYNPTPGTVTISGEFASNNYETILKVPESFDIDTSYNLFYYAGNKTSMGNLINVTDNSGGLVDLSIGTVNVDGQIYKEFKFKQSGQTEFTDPSVNLFYSGLKYKFDVSNPDFSNNITYFTTSNSDSTKFLTGISFEGIPGTANAKMVFLIPEPEEWTSSPESSTLGSNYLYLNSLTNLINPTSVIDDAFNQINANRNIQFYTNSKFLVSTLKTRINIGVGEFVKQDAGSIFIYDFSNNTNEYEFLQKITNPEVQSNINYNKNFGNSISFNNNKLAFSTQIVNNDFPYIENDLCYNQNIETFIYEFDSTNNIFKESQKLTLLDNSINKIHYENSLALYDDNLIVKYLDFSKNQLDTSNTYINNTTTVQAFFNTNMYSISNDVFKVGQDLSTNNDVDICKNVFVLNDVRFNNNLHVEKEIITDDSEALIQIPCNATINDVSCNNFYLNSSTLANEFKYDWSGNTNLFLVKNLNNENDKTNDPCEADISFIQNVHINQNLDVSNLIVYGDVSINQSSNIPYEIRGNLKTTQNVYSDICLNLYNFNANVLTNTEKLTRINYESIGEDSSTNFASKNSIALNNDFILIGDLCANVIKTGVTTKNVGEVQVYKKNIIPEKIQTNNKINNVFSNNWTLIDKLTANSDFTNYTENRKFGSSLSIDASNMVIGSHDMISIYNYSNTTNQWVHKRDISDLIHYNDVTNSLNDDLYFGKNVNIHNNKIVVSGGSKLKKIYIYENTSDFWTTDISGVIDFSTNEFDTSFNNVGKSIQQNDNFLALSNHSDLCGNVFIYDISNSVKLNEDISFNKNDISFNITSSDGSLNDAFGYDLALDNSYLFVGAPNTNSNSGSVYVYEFDSATKLYNEKQKLTAKDNNHNDYFGSCIDLYEDYVLITSPGKTYATNTNTFTSLTNVENDGAAYVFQNISGTWHQIEKLTNPHQDTHERFGTSVALYDNNYLISNQTKSTYDLCFNDLFVYKNKVKLSQFYDLSINGDLSMNLLNSYARFNDLIINDDISHNKHITVNNNVETFNLKVDQDVSINGNLFVENDVSLSFYNYVGINVNTRNARSDVLNLNKGLNVTGNFSSTNLYTKQNNDICVNNITNLDDVSMNNNFYVNDISTNNITSLADVSTINLINDGNVNIKRLITTYDNCINNVTIIDDVSMNNNLYAEDMCTNNIYLQNSVTSKNIKSTSDCTFVNCLAYTINPLDSCFNTLDVSTLNVNGNLNIQENINLSNIINCELLDISNNLYVVNDTSINKLISDTDVTFNKHLLINNNLTVTNDLSYHNDICVNNITVLNEDVSFSNHCTVYNDVSTNSLNLTKPGLVITDICINNVYVEESILDLSNVYINENVTTQNLYLTSNGKLDISSINISNDDNRILSIDGSMALLKSAKLVIQNNMDGSGVNGIFLLNNNSTDYGIYLASSLSGTTLANDTPCSVLDISNLATRFRMPRNENNGWIFENNSTNKLVGFDSSYGNVFINGKMGIGIDPANSTNCDFEIQGTDTSYNSYSLFTSHEISTPEITLNSDNRIKTDIEHLTFNKYENLINKINELRVKKYNFKEIVNRSKHERYGLIAQEVKEIFPNSIDNVQYNLTNGEVIKDLNIINKDEIYSYLILCIQKLTNQEKILKMVYNPNDYILNNVYNVNNVNKLVSLINIENNKMIFELSNNKKHNGVYGIIKNINNNKIILNNEKYSYVYIIIPKLITNYDKLIRCNICSSHINGYGIIQENDKIYPNTIGYITQIIDNLIPINNDTEKNMEKNMKDYKIILVKCKIY